MELIIIISVEITGIKLLPKIREFNDVFLEVSAERRGAVGGGRCTQLATFARGLEPTSTILLTYLLLLCCEIGSSSDSSS